VSAKFWKDRPQPKGSTSLIKRRPIIRLLEDILGTRGSSHKIITRSNIRLLTYYTTSNATMKIDTKSPVMITGGTGMSDMSED
jgi:hypothetical protein